MQGVLCIVGMVQAAAVMRRTPLASNILHPWLHFVIATAAAASPDPAQNFIYSPYSRRREGGQFKVERAHANAT